MSPLQIEDTKFTLLVLIWMLFLTFHHRIIKLQGIFRCLRVQPPLSKAGPPSTLASFDIWVPPIVKFPQLLCTTLLPFFNLPHSNMFTLMRPPEPHHMFRMKMNCKFTKWHDDVLYFVLFSTPEYSTSDVFLSVCTTRVMIWCFSGNICYSPKTIFLRRKFRSGRAHLCLIQGAGPDLIPNQWDWSKQKIVAAQKCTNLSETVLKYYPVVRRDISTSGSRLSYIIEISHHMCCVALCATELFLGGTSSHNFSKKSIRWKKSWWKSSARITYLVGDKSKAVYDFRKIHRHLFRNFIPTMFSVKLLPKICMTFERMLWKKNV